MKKLYLATLFCLTLASVSANPGDTTIVQAHKGTQLSWYNNYDTTVTFPDGSLSYRKIIMEFTLGKYACPGYNPNNPGEGQGQTGWCADWDYDIHLIACIPGGDTLELGRLITPYANSNFPRTPASWQHAYQFDVTDYYPLLKGNVTLRIQYAGYSGGFTGSLRFYMIEGTRARDVVGIRNLWQGSFPYGNSAGSIDTKITPQTLTMPEAASTAAMKVLITGHGGDKPENCAEFCKKWYQFKVNNTMVKQQDIWRDDCGSNFLYPQSGTWVYDRGNWCPGDLVHEHIFELPSTITSGSTFTTDLDFQPYASGDNSALYKIAAALFFYGPIKHTLDAGIEDIISPSNNETHYRSNPVCGQPTIKVKNYGSSAINNLQLEYGVAGQTLSNYTWTGHIASLDEAMVTLPSLPTMNNLTAGQLSTYEVKIIGVNNNKDEDSLNNFRSASFVPAPKWEGGNFRIDLKMSGNIEGNVNELNWTIKNMADSVLFERKGTESAKLYQDEIHLEDGCYKLEVATNIGRGLNFFGFFGKGYFRISDRKTQKKIALPKTDLGSSSLEANFGNGFIQYFTVQNAEVLDINGIQKGARQVAVYPNPAQDQLYLSVATDRPEQANIRLFNVIGQELWHTRSQKTEVTIPLQIFANGIYYLEYKTNDYSHSEKIVISR